MLVRKNFLDDSRAGLHGSSTNKGTGGRKDTLQNPYQPPKKTSGSNNLQNIRENFGRKFQISHNKAQLLQSFSVVLILYSLSQTEIYVFFTIGKIQLIFKIRRGLFITSNSCIINKLFLLNSKSSLG